MNVWHQSWLHSAIHLELGLLEKTTDEESENLDFRLSFCLLVAMLTLDKLLNMGHRDIIC